MKQGSRAARLACLAAAALTLAGCGTSGPASVPGLRLAIGNSLPGTQGKTLDDQDRIDDTVAGGCAADVYRPEECDLHTAASAARRRELRKRAGA